MKRLILCTVVLAAMYALQSCGNNNTAKTDSTDSAKTMNEAKGTADKDVSDFTAKAASGGLMEVQLGQYAAQNAVSPRVKAFGNMMVQDHTKANDELKSLAAAQNITLPGDLSDEQKKHVNELMQKKGKDFDKAYMDMMVDDHKEDIAEFQKAGDNLKDTTIKSFAQRTLPVLNVHLDSANAIHSAMK
ncbi:DUF4142 domain-containing protein [Deminuibacter soli]|uniref:DUF4142 domain-containing protein n=1 Tax=Deminuibacter soli TaxID=2291815 RepID=A0A3E1NIW0_9BACT|nr:DUF4142 domain-containing protein [Deminuibacter soli]RFM27873.1 DUF4142 domain-containing protein [Deminuibacter soli]